MYPVVLITFMLDNISKSMTHCFVIYDLLHLIKFILLFNYDCDLNGVYNLQTHV